MNKKLIILLSAILIAVVCALIIIPKFVNNAHFNQNEKTESETSPSPTPSLPSDKSLKMNLPNKISDTLYEGTLKAHTDKEITVTVDNADYVYILSERAANDLKVLEISDNDTIIVEFERKEGSLTALRLEKVISQLD